MSHTHFPDHWETAPLEDVTEFVTSGSRGWGDFYADSGPLFLRVGNLNHDTIDIDLCDAVYVQPPIGSEGLRTRIEEGDILISITAEVGMVGLARHGLGEAYVNQHVALVRPLPSVYSEGLAYSLLDPQGLQFAARRQQYGATKPGLSLSQVRGFEVPIPPLQEQHRIVAAIESYFTRLDDAVATLSRVERNLKRYRASVLKSAVEGRLVPTEAALAKQEGRDYEPASVLLERILTERRRRWTASGKKGKYEEPAPPDTTGLPELPEGWCWTTIGAVAESLDRLRIPVNKSERLNHVGDVPYYGANGQVGWIDKAIFNEPLVLVVEDETFTGREKPFCYKIVGPSWVNNHAHVLRPTEAISIDYLNYSLMFYPFVPLTTGTTGRRKLTQAALLGAPYALPPLREQQRIVSQVAEVLDTADAAARTAEKSRIRSMSLRQSILKWAFEGKLADQDPSDEPASVLLERIKAERDLPKSAKKKSRA